MHLYYYRDPAGNFGDDLNPWIWYSLLPHYFDQDRSELFVGIGTLINDKVPAAPRKVVFGSGLGYNGFPKIDDKWSFKFVRGPLTAEKLGLDPALAITDPAVLIAELVSKAAPEKTIDVSFMPHHVSTRYADWRAICVEAGVHYLDPADDIHETLYALRQSRLVIAEAMHAAIAADALRVPWLPVRCYGHILEFKWRDWCATIGVEYQPVELPQVFDVERNMSPAAIRKAHVKRSMKAAGIWSANWWNPPPANNKLTAQPLAVQRMRELSRSATACLSRDQAHADNLGRVLGVLRACAG